MSRQGTARYMNLPKRVGYARRYTEVHPDEVPISLDALDVHLSYLGFLPASRSTDSRIRPRATVQSRATIAHFPLLAIANGVSLGR